MSATLEEIEARRDKRKAELAELRDMQRAIDLEALDALEVEHGDSNVAYLEVSFTPGLPLLVAARCPKPAEIKRYQERLKPKANGKTGDPIAAAEEIAACCRVYPNAEVYKDLLEARPGVNVQVGLLALELATGKAHEEGKD
jgi:hypothetical protein